LLAPNPFDVSLGQTAFELTSVHRHPLPKAPANLVRLKGCLRRRKRLRPWTRTRTRQSTPTAAGRVRWVDVIVGDCLFGEELSDHPSILRGPDME